MRWMVRTVSLGIAAIALLGSLSLAFGQNPVRAERTIRRVPPRIVITPRRLLYRRCTERLQLQYRPSGPVLYPLTYCWWVTD